MSSGESSDPWEAVPGLPKACQVGCVLPETHILGLHLGLCPVSVSEASSLGLTSCLYRQLSAMSSEGEGHVRTMPRRRLGPAEKVAQAGEVKANGMLIEEEKVEMGRVSRVNEEGWRG